MTQGWLLVLDNVEDVADIEPLLGQLGGGHVIVTSRRDADWGRLADPVRLDILSSATAARVLTGRTGQHGAADVEAFAGIAAELGFLPLALERVSEISDTLRAMLGGDAAREDTDPEPGTARRRTASRRAGQADPPASTLSS